MEDPSPHDFERRGSLNGGAFGAKKAVSKTDGLQLKQDLKDTTGKSQIFCQPLDVSKLIPLGPYPLLCDIFSGFKPGLKI